MSKAKANLHRSFCLAVAWLAVAVSAQARAAAEAVKHGRRSKNLSAVCLSRSDGQRKADTFRAARRVARESTAASSVAGWELGVILSRENWTPGLNSPIKPSSMEVPKCLVHF